MLDRASLLFGMLTLSQLYLFRAETSEVIVDLLSGKLQGNIKASSNGKLYKQFLGIPFAQAPIGQLRFAPPQPVDGWSGVREATSFPPICPQPPMPSPLNETFAGLSMNENCLFLNVFAPSTADPNSKLPVMVFIHGGGFTMGGTPGETASILATLHDVIVVGIQYRLGILGFFNVPGTETKGNYGLMDQVEALKWVQGNIANFGGDSSKVTIFGESAGAISVSLLMLIPQAENLFHRLIAQSGTAASLHACYRIEDTKPAEAYLGFLDCSLENNYLECMRKKSSDEILNGQLMLMSPEASKLGPNSLTIPVVDDVYISDIPRNLLRQGKFHRVPTVFGYTADEGALVPTMSLVKGPLAMYTPQFFQGLLYSLRHTPDDDNELVKAAIVQQYTKHGLPQTPENVREQIMDFFGDSVFIAPTALTLGAFAASGNPGYLYIFNHRSKYSVWPEWVGINHADELPYVFGAPFQNPLTSENPLTTGFTEMEKGLSQFMMKLWTNFAKSGDPNSQEGGHDLVTWPKYTNDNREYLEIGLEWKVGRNHRPKEMAFWNEFLPKLSAPKAVDQETVKKTRDEL